MESANTPNKKREYAIMGILALLLLGSLGYNIYQGRQHKTEKELIQVDLKDEQAAKQQLQNELDVLTSEFEKTRKDLGVRDSILSKRDAEIFDKQKEIQNILNKNKISDSELKQAKRMIAALNADIARFKEEIADLKMKNDSLVVVNETLTVEKNTITEELVSQKQKADDTEASVRSTFSISNYQLTGLKVRKSGKEIETDKARRIDKLRVSFDLDPNNYAESGPKEIFIAIYKPDGTLGKFKDASSGELETWSMGKVKYSDKVSFNYTKGTKQNITFDWEDYDFPKGTYKIDLYQNGFKIGQKSLNLR